MAGKIHFGVYELDCDAMELRKHGVLIRLQEQPLRVLATLVERPGEIVTREELRERTWGKDTFVDFEQSLNRRSIVYGRHCTMTRVAPNMWRRSPDEDIDLSHQSPE